MTKHNVTFLSDEYNINTITAYKDETYILNAAKEQHISLPY